MGRRDTDRGALIGSRADERQATLQMKVWASQGKVLTVGAFIAYVIAIAIATKTTTAGSALDGALSRRKNRRHRWTGHRH